MAVSYRILGQANTAGAITTYNTIAGPVATGKSWIVSTIVVCNQTASAQTYRLAVSGSTAPSSSEFIVFGSTVPANDTVTLTLGITMQAGKYIMASGTSSSISVSAFGTEIS
jgi:hypothetical protein